MIIYRIYSKDVDRERIERLCLEELLFGAGFTITNSKGYKTHCPQRRIVIELIGREQDKKTVLNAASRIKTATKQKSVTVVMVEAQHVLTIGDRITFDREAR